MRLVVQRVSRASVREGDELLGEIGAGALILAGIGADDDAATIDRMADKLLGLRYIRDVDGRTNLDIADAGGRRPGFTAAAQPDVAVPLLDRFVERLRASGIAVETGRFGAEMAVELVNDGPFTLVIDSERDLA